MNKKEIILMFTIISSLVLVTFVLAIPLVDFISLTPANATLQTARNVEINVSITETNLKEVIYNWNGTNFTLYDNSLVLMYNFDNVSDLGENATYAVDLSNSGNDGIAYNGSTFISSGKYGGAFEFDGVDDYMNLTQNSNLGTLDITISTWVNLDSTFEQGAFVKIGDGNTGIGIGVGANSFDNSGNNLIILYELERWIDTNYNIGTGWHHVALVVNSNGFPEGFIDGILVYSDSLGVPRSPTNSINIGGYNERQVDATIDEVRIWNQSLSSAEIYQQYVSNLNKFNSTQWYLYVNQSKNATAGLSDGVYTYSTLVKDTLENINLTETRTIIIDTSFPDIVVNFPANNTYSSNSGLNVNYTVLDANKDSCWYSETSVASNTTLAGCTNINSVIWSEGQHNVTVWVNDSAGNTNSSSITFTIDTNLPTWENNKTNLITSTNSGTSVYFNITLNDTNSDQYIFSWYNGTVWTNSSSGSYASGQEISVTKTIPINSGEINWTWYFNDTAGNNNQTKIWSVTLGIIDTDKDGLPDSLDPLLYNESNVTTSGITKLNITVGGNKTSDSFSGLQEIRFYDQTNLIIKFNHNFSTSNFDLSNITIIKTSSSLITNLSGQLQGNKTLYLTDNSFVSLCVKDSEVNSINEISSNCTGSNETDFTLCLGGNLSSNGINCIDQGSIIKIENLQHSAVRGTQANTLSSGGGGGGGSYQCNKDSQCQSNEACMWNQCIKIDCTVNTDCSYGQYCSNNNCKDYECVKNTDCDLSQYCSNNNCKDYECSSDSECKIDEGEVCRNHTCLKLFDILITKFEQSAKVGDFFSFDYKVIGMANISDDVDIQFWIENEKRKITSGKDVIYVGNFEEVTGTGKLLLPSSMNSGIYTFYTKLKHEEYEVESHRTIEISVDANGGAKITGNLVVQNEKSNNSFTILIGINILILLLVFYLERKKIKKLIKKEEKWIKKHKFTVLTFFLLTLLTFLIYYFN